MARLTHLRQRSQFTAAFKEYARSIGADLVGIANIERFDDVAANHHPRAIFPEGRSVVMIGKRITRGSLRGVEEGTQFDLYSQYGRDWLNNRFLAMCTFKAAEFLEDNGWESVPVPNLPPQVPPMGIPVREGQPAPNVMIDFEDAAVRAGLGEIGFCGVLLTPQFGPRQRVQLIITDAPLDPDPLVAEPICDRCVEKEEACPLGAIHVESVTERVICGKAMPVARIEYGKCRSCANGAAPNPHYTSGLPDRLAAFCMRTCVSHLEETGRVQNTFENPFRQRNPWQVITERRIIS
jgi:epoxyqueuosine reductase QueG